MRPAWRGARLGLGSGRTGCVERRYSLWVCEERDSERMSQDMLDTGCCPCHGRGTVYGCACPRADWYWSNSGERAGSRGIAQFCCGVSSSRPSCFRACECCRRPFRARCLVTPITPWKGCTCKIRSARSCGEEIGRDVSDLTEARDCAGRGGAAGRCLGTPTAARATRDHAQSRGGRSRHCWHVSITAPQSGLLQPFSAKSTTS